jgi:hypothetical protein
VAVSSRSYVGPTNVLATTFDADSGRLRLTDFMPIEPHGARDETIQASRCLHRLVEGTGGTVRLEVRFRPTFDFGRVRTDVVPHAAVGRYTRRQRESTRSTREVR